MMRMKTQEQSIAKEKAVSRLIIKSLQVIEQNDQLEQVRHKPKQKSLLLFRHEEAQEENKNKCISDNFFKKHIHFNFYYNKNYFIFTFFSFY